MNVPDRSDLDQLARALAALLAAWWRYHGRNDEATQTPEFAAQDYLARLKETTTQARAPPQNATTVWSSVRRQNANNSRK
jgi:mannitol-1-phosphate/altronate dehydrogenase